MSELIILVRKRRRVGGDVVIENDALRYIRTLKRLFAGGEVICTRGKKIAGSAGNEPDIDQVVVLAMA